MRTLGCFLLVLMLAACTDPGSGTDFPEPESLPAVQIRLSNPSPKIGERMDLTLRVSGEKRLVLPPVREWLHPALEVLETESRAVEEESKWVQERKLQLTVFQVTNLTLFAENKITTLSEEPEDIDLPLQRIQVTSVLPEENPSPIFGDDHLPDFRGPEALRRRKRNLIISAAAAVLLLTGTALVAWWLARRPKPLPPAVPPHKIALRKMEELTRSEVWQRPDVDASAVALSLILREYIEARFDIRAPEQTTEEFLESVEAHAPWPEKEQVGLKEFFAVTDRIKFAGSRPGGRVLEDLMQAARGFVESTAVDKVGEEFREASA